MSALPYDERGSGEPVLLIHAGVADRSMWSEHVGWLADAGFRAIAVDLPGFGQAVIQPGPQAPWEDVLQTMRELGLARTALVGNSFGAAVALRVAAVAPAAVSSLMLVSPPPLDGEPSPRLKAAWDAEEGALARGDMEGAVAAVLEAWLPAEAPAELRRRVAMMQRRAYELQTSADPSEPPDPLDQHREALAELTMPVLATVGETDMPDFHEGAREMAALLPAGRAEVMEGVGHLAPLEAPERFRDMLLGFLRGQKTV